MDRKLTSRKYEKLVEDIIELYENARRHLAAFYWGTGRRIVEVEQEGKVRAPHSTSLLKELSKDLTRRVGSGFSVQNLRKMRSVYLESRKRSAPSVLDWTQQVELLPIKDQKQRLVLEKKAARDGLTTRQIRMLVRKERRFKTASKMRATPGFSPLKRPQNLRLYTYRKADLLPEAAKFGIGNGAWIDCGFYLRRLVPESRLKNVTLTDKPAYTYAAVVERIVDGDTLVAVINAGFGNVVQWRMRLRGIDCPELATAEGKEAKRYVEKLLPRGSRLVVKSSKTDLHGRFVADIFFREDRTASFEDIAKSGVWLNQHLLDQGLAVRKDA